MKDLTLLERAAIVRSLVWTDTPVPYDGTWVKAWVVSLVEVLVDAVGEAAEVWAPALAFWCTRQADPPGSARFLASVAIHAADEEPLRALLALAS